MFRIKNSVYFLLVIFFFTECSKQYEVPQELEIQDFIWKGLNAYYLHQEEIPDLSDRRFSSDEQLNSFLNTFLDNNSLFNSLLIAEDNSSNYLEDFILERDSVTSIITNGIEYGIIRQPESDENVIGYVTLVLPNSDASTKNINRGEFFYAIDNEILTVNNYENLLENGSDSYVMSFANFNGTTLFPNGKSIELTKLPYEPNVILDSKIITNNGNNIGYLSFAKHFDEEFTAEVNQNIQTFVNANISTLVLDFRYSLVQKSNAATINEFVSIISNENTSEISIKEQWNSKAQTWFQANQPDSLVTRFTNFIKPNTPLNRMNVTDVYIILNGLNYEGSASLELLINTLKPFVNVNVVGSQTSGNNKGKITLYDSLDYNSTLRSENHNAAIEPVVLEFFNANDETYADGFVPDITLCETENPLALGILGEDSEFILNKILEHIQFGTINDTNCENEFNILYNSRNRKIEPEKGVYITQILPNTL